MNLERRIVTGEQLNSEDISYKENDTTDEKHLKYKNQYAKNTLYWGLGIENELYLEFEHKYNINKKELLDKNKRKRERYSVDYYTNYNMLELNNALQFYVDNTPELELHLPMLLNSNSFTRTDMTNNSKTQYTKLCEPNPKFNGHTLIETLQKHNTYFMDNINNNWLFDGDTIEFNTLYFFNITLQDIIDELNVNKCDFIRQLNDSFTELHIFNSYGNVKIMEKNHPFCTYMTNFKNINMFNNGTLHYNVTLPTQLNEKGKIKDMDKFIQDHSKAIKIIQWMEPFLIAIYNTPDPFSLMKNYPNNHKFSKASQRCAISRYIGVGTYDSTTMQTGKILLKPINEIICNNLDYWWFNQYYNNSAYVKLNDIGVDINFNKHYNHGIELRFIDNITDNAKLFELFEFIIYLMDYILESDLINIFGNPIMNKIWNNFMLKIIVSGNECELNHSEIEIYENIFKLKISMTKLNDIYYELYNKLMLRYNTLYKTSTENIYTLVPNGKFSSLCLKSYNKKLEHTNTIIFNPKIYILLPEQEQELKLELKLELNLETESDTETETNTKHKKTYCAIFCKLITKKCKKIFNLWRC